MPTLLDPYSLKGLQLKNRIVMPPMCQYSVTKKDGKPNDWHFSHYTSRAIGGAGLIIMEMTDVEPDGRITDGDLGLWSDDHIESFSKIILACQAYGAKVAVQVAHAGRKAEDAEQPVSCSPIPFSNRYKTPRELTTQEVKMMVDKFEAACKRAVLAGVDAIELHGAHGYLIHQFHSPLTNHRTDIYGEEKSRFGVEVIEAARRVMPETMPLIIRLSAVEYTQGGYGLDYLIEIARTYQEAGVDMFHVSSGGEGVTGAASSGPGYQVSFAEEIRKKLNVPVIAVGRLEDPQLANQIIREGKADLAAVGRGMLRNPYWATEASLALGGKPLTPEALSRGYYI